MLAFYDSVECEALPAAGEWVGGEVVVEVQLLLAGDGMSLPGGGVEDPLLDGGEDHGVYSLAQAFAGDSLRDSAVFVDLNTYDDFSRGAGGEVGEVGFLRGEGLDQDDAGGAAA